MHEVDFAGRAPSCQAQAVRAVTWQQVRARACSGQLSCSISWSVALLVESCVKFLSVDITPGVECGLKKLSRKIVNKLSFSYPASCLTIAISGRLRTSWDLREDMSLNHIASQLNGLRMSGQTTKPTSAAVINAVLRQAIEQHIPTGRRYWHECVQRPCMARDTV